MTAPAWDVRELNMFEIDAVSGAGDVDWRSVGVATIGGAAGGAVGGLFTGSLVGAAVGLIGGGLAGGVTSIVVQVLSDE